MERREDNQPQGVILETPRLVIRRWREDDAEALFRYASDPRVSEMALWPCHTSVEMSWQVICDYFIPNTENYAMVLKELDEPIGCIGLVPSGDEHFPVRDGEREVGYWIGYPHWGKGITTEALQYLLSFWKEKRGIKSLIITTDAENIGSQHVAEKCGFRFVKEYDFDGVLSRLYRKIF